MTDIIDRDIGELSDGFHTFNELYEHRHLLFCLVMNLKGWSYDPWKSRWHADGTMFQGWFIAGMQTPMLMDITYHMPMAYWDLCPGTELPKAPPWDGHTSADVAERLRDWLKEWKRANLP